MLTDAQVRKAKAAERPYKMADGGGLHVFVSPAGGKLWRFRYEFGGKEKLLVDRPLSPPSRFLEARTARDDAKAVLRDGSRAQESPRSSASWPALPARPIRSKRSPASGSRAEKAAMG